MKMLAIISVLTLALAACGTNSFQGRAANAGISAAISVPLCAAVPVAGCIVGSFVATEGVNRVGNALSDGPRL